MVFIIFKLKLHYILSGIFWLSQEIYTVFYIKILMYGILTMATYWFFKTARACRNSQAT